MKSAFPAHRVLAALLAISSLASSAPCRAESRPKWELGAGGVFYTQPDYVGSDEYRFRAYPFPWIVYRGSRLRLDRESVQTKIFGTDLVRLDLSASGQIAVDSDDNDRRHGMRDLDWIAQIGPTLRFPVWMSDQGRHVLEVDVPLRVALAVDIDNFSYEGLVSSPKLQYRYEPDVYRFEVNAGLEFSSNDYNDYIYRVAPKYATPDRRAYNPDGGYAGVRLSAGVSRYIGPIYVGVFARYINVDGAAFEDSPLVGSDSFFMGGIAIGWVWLKSSEMVPVGAEANLVSRGRVPSKPEEPEADESAGTESETHDSPAGSGAPGADTK